MLVEVALSLALLSPVEEIRICPIQRDTAGKIKRSAAVRSAFQKIYPCPSNGAQEGPCPGWQVDHVIPLACGGCDAVWNMQWLPGSIKSSTNTDAKDRWERKVYCEKGHHRPQ